MKTFKELYGLIIEWAEEKGILNKATVSSQYAKFQEEYHEYLNDDDKLDAIGDMAVVLIILIEMLDFYEVEDIEEHFKEFIDISKKLSFKVNPNILLEKHISSLHSIIDIELTSPDWISVQEQASYAAILVLGSLQYLCTNYYNTTLEKCLNDVYDIISKRTGKMVNGMFVKDEGSVLSKKLHKKYLDKGTYKLEVGNYIIGLSYKGNYGAEYLIQVKNTPFASSHIEAILDMIEHRESDYVPIPFAIVTKKWFVNRNKHSIYITKTEVMFKKVEIVKYNHD